MQLADVEETGPAPVPVEAESRTRYVVKEVSGPSPPQVATLTFLAMSCGFAKCATGSPWLLASHYEDQQSAHSGESTLVRPAPNALPKPIQIAQHLKRTNGGPYGFNTSNE